MDNIINSSNEYVKYISGGKLGDFIFQLSIIYEIYLLTKKKGILYITNIGDKFTFSLEKTYSDIKDIILKQEYIKIFTIYNNEEYDINLSKWRENININNTWYDIFKKTYNVEWGCNKWLYLDKNDKYKDMIFIFSSLTRVNKKFEYEQIEKLNKKIYFITMNKNEYDKFILKTKKKYELLLFTNLNDFWIAITNCYLFVSNQSSPLCVAIASYTNTYMLLHDNDEIKLNNFDNIKIFK